jgi:putative addiction module killer protein
LDTLDAVAAAKVTTAVRRLELSNFSNVKGVGAGVFEYRIDCGAGYRVYFGKDGDAVGISGLNNGWSTGRNGAVITGTTLT